MNENKHRILNFNFEEIPNECRPERWWIQDLLPKRRLVLLAAQGGTGKTSLAVYLSKYSAASIYQVLNGNRKTAGGYHWKRITPKDIDKANK